MCFCESDAMTVPLLNKGGELLFDQVHEAKLQAFAVMVELNAS